MQSIDRQTRQTSSDPMTIISQLTLFLKLQTFFFFFFFLGSVLLFDHHQIILTVDQERTHPISSSLIHTVSIFKTLTYRLRLTCLSTLYNSVILSSYPPRKSCSIKSFDSTLKIHNTLVHISSDSLQSSCCSQPGSSIIFITGSIRSYYTLHSNLL